MRRSANKGLHLSYRRPGVPEAVHVVSTGDCLIGPRGLQSRRYDLAVPDPHYAEVQP